MYHLSNSIFLCIPRAKRNDDPRVFDESIRLVRRLVVVERFLPVAIRVTRSRRGLLFELPLANAEIGDRVATISHLSIQFHSIALLFPADTRSSVASTEHRMQHRSRNS